ncbi:hypothetical protein LS74_000915 [Helicobacter magdeburgensis]|uniref:Outer membrane beta-barrel protein n=2 Tax=Helicobacter magdeburgensis TaxID=471858 RepID=A0A4U8T3M9_9HELI|nr:hypothetical protein LS74_000915 [Helicobacter magdeburgensis]
MRRCEMKRYIFLLCGISLCLLQGRESIDRIGIQEAWFNHKAGKSEFNAAHTMLYYEYETIYDNRFAHNGFVGLGGSAGNLNGIAPVVGSELLSTAPVRGGLGINIDINFGLGYYFITRTRDNPLYLGIGLRESTGAITYGNMPIAAQLGGTYLPLELRGNVALNHKVKLEYLASYDVLLGTGGGVGVNGSNQSHTLSFDGGQNALRFMLGLRYYVNETSFFFTQLYARFESLGASSSLNVSMPADSTTPGVIAGASATIHYPKSHTSFVGLRVGFGF